MSLVFQCHIARSSLVKKKKKKKEKKKNHGNMALPDVKFMDIGSVLATRKRCTVVTTETVKLCHTDCELALTVLTEKLTNCLTISINT